MFNFGPSLQMAQRFTGSPTMNPNPQMGMGMPMRRPMPQSFNGNGSGIRRPMPTNSTDIIPQTPIGIDTGSGIGSSIIGNSFHPAFDIPRKPVDGALNPGAGINPLQNQGLMKRYSQLSSREPMSLK